MANMRKRTNVQMPPTTVPVTALSYTLSTTHNYTVPTAKQLVYNLTLSHCRKEKPVNYQQYLLFTSRLVTLAQCSLYS